MLGVMRGAVNVGGVFGRLRPYVHSGIVDTDSTPVVYIITPPDDFLVNNALASLTFLFLP